MEHENSQGGEDRGVDLISDALPFGRLWYGGPNAISSAIGYARITASLLGWVDTQPLRINR
jgi:hypothetical protein